MRLLPVVRMIGKPPLETLRLQCALGSSLMIGDISLLHFPSKHR
jgi:hypothetical protein